MKKLFRNAIILSLLLVSITGCASVVHRSKQTVKISSQPGSTISIKDLKGNTIIEGEDSLTVKLDRAQGFFQKGQYSIVVEKPGYATKTIQLSSKVNTGSYVIGNLFVGGFIGWLVVDPLTGGMWTLTTPDGQKAKDVQIVLKENVSESDLKKANKIN
ncbi:MAG: hypothetical protein JW924_00930 [Fusobacteriaceae bacterium]|nr:hypothetical protein [Fusobacteriaceae bacterium]